MKKIYVLPLLIVFALALAACGANNQSTQNPAAGGAGQSTGQGQQAPSNRPISPALQLAVGIFKLEGTPQAVDAKQAAQLLPLWQLYGQLETSSSSASQEITATFSQIQSTMTPDQTKAITAMNLTNQDAFAFMQQQGIVQQGGFGSNGTPEANRTPRAGGGGGFPGGGGGFGPGGNGGAPGGSGQNLNPSQIATAQARRAQGGGFSNRLPKSLLDALMKLLQSKVNPTGLTPSISATPSTETPMPLTETPAITPTP